MPDPTVLVVMGVSGSGKSTVAGLLAQRLGWAFADGDDFHAPEHIARMRAGQALTDADREPWLALVRAWIDARLAAGTSGVIVCSALRRAYRDALRRDRPGVRIVYLEGSRALIAERLSRRRGHFMPAGLLDSQFAALEPPGPEERPIIVGIADGPAAIAAAIATRLGFSQAPGNNGTGRMDIALVVSDVDGTLVTTDKRLTPAAIAAVQRLDEAGIAFTVASARPPIGFEMLVEPLHLRLPLGAFNGGTLVGPDLVALSTMLIPEETAREAVDHLLRAGIDVWVFADGIWTLRDPDAPYADLERRTLGVEPAVASDLGPLLASAQKIVGVSRDADGLARAEADLSEAIGERAGIERSQAYYLDVTPPGVSKGSFVLEMSRRFRIAPDKIATIGDAGNDVAMFRASGLSIAMGNADPEVQAAASAVTASNDENGFAEAIERIILG